MLDLWLKNVLFSNAIIYGHEHRFWSHGVYLFMLSYCDVKAWTYFSCIYAKVLLVFCLMVYCCYVFGSGIVVHFWVEIHLFWSLFSVICSLFLWSLCWCSLSSKVKSHPQSHIYSFSYNFNGTREMKMMELSIWMELMRFNANLI